MYGYILATTYCYDCYQKTCTVPTVTAAVLLLLIM